MFLASYWDVRFTAFLRNAYLHSSTSPLHSPPLTCGAQLSATVLSNTTDVLSASLVQNPWWMMGICNSWFLSSEDFMLNEFNAFFVLFCFFTYFYLRTRLTFFGIALVHPVLAGTCLLISSSECSAGLLTVCVFLSTMMKYKEENLITCY